jgi:hypothetical protein
VVPETSRLFDYLNESYKKVVDFIHSFLMAPPNTINTIASSVRTSTGLPPTPLKNGETFIPGVPIWGLLLICEVVFILVLVVSICIFCRFAKGSKGNGINWERKIGFTHIAVANPNYVRYIKKKEQDKNAKLLTDTLAENRLLQKNNQPVQVILDRRG